ncbi:MAG TPA: PepSY domain-containing protein [Pirellulales bacterium]|nr:PepSY domain-containing protein [Pirellulales bacterium]
MRKNSLGIVAFAAPLLAAFAWAAGDEAKEDAHARANLPKAKITLAEAVEIAMKKVPDGKAVEAELEMKADHLQFVVEIVTGKRHHEVEIDAVSGKVTKTEIEDQEKLEAGETAEEHEENEALETEAAATAKFTLLKAIHAALKDVKGSKAFEANFEREEGKLVISVELLAADEISEAEFDAMTGKLIEIEKQARR